MDWRLVRSLETLRRQINAAYPNRSKASDGTIGDTAHSHRPSDHNPEGDGTVDALDITHDPAHGLDIQTLCDSLVASRDPRIKYIICNGKIISGREGPSPWAARKYSGPNKHTKHIHISVLDTGQDDASNWRIDLPMAAPEPEHGILHLGSNGPYVITLQGNLNRLGFGPLKEDGDFGEKTELAVKAFQASAGLKPDGWAGPDTLKAIGEKLKALETAPKVDHAEEVVKEQTGWWQKITGVFGFGGVGGGMLFGLQWQTVAIIAGVAVLAIIILILLRRQIIGAVKDIRAAVEG